MEGKGFERPPAKPDASMLAAQRYQVNAMSRRVQRPTPSGENFAKSRLAG